MTTEPRTFPSNANMAQDLCGVWQRRMLLTADKHLDTRSLVIYLQTPNLAADIRVPIDRPALTGTSLADYDEAALNGLLDQEGFVARFFRHGTRVRWDRFIDYAPLAGVPDESWMEVSGDLAVEYGMHVDFVEHWWRREGAWAPYLVLQGAAQPGRWLFRVGAHFLYVRDRSTALNGRPLREAFASAATVEDRRALLDCELSWGRWRAGSAPRIERSTLPFREGSALDPDARADADAILWNGDGWNVVESAFSSTAAACIWLAGADDVELEEHRRPDDHA